MNITGDVFTFTDANGNEIAKEKQIKRWGIKLNRLARLMDTEGNITGYIGEEFFTDFLSLSKYNFHIYDEERNELGYTKERILSLFYEFNVYDVSDEILFKISKKLDIVDSYEIVKQKESDISMKDVAAAEHNRESYTDMTDEELENTIIRQAADMQESPLVGQQYIFFLGAPTDDMPADAYEQLGWKFCQMLVGDDDTLYYLPYPAEDALSPADTANDIAHITLNDLRELIHRYTS